MIIPSTMFSTVIGITSLAGGSLWFWYYFKKHQRVFLTLKAAHSQHTHYEHVAETVRTLSDIKAILNVIGQTLVKSLQLDRCVIHDCVSYGYIPEDVSYEFNATGTQNLLTTSSQESDYQKFLRDQRIFQRMMKGEEAVELSFNNTPVLLLGALFRKKLNTILFLQRPLNEGWSKEDIAFAQSIAGQIAIAMGFHRNEVLKEMVAAKIEADTLADRLTKELEQERKTVELQNEFVSMASHEFRTPLAIITSACELIERKSTTHLPVIEKHLFKIRDSVSRMKQLIESTLCLSKLESGKITFNPDYFNFKTMLENTLSSFIELNKEINFKINTNSLPSYFYGDSYLLNQAISNVIANAVKYSVCEENPAPSITINSSQDNLRFELIIEDNGIGIPEEDIARIGTKFFRARNSLGTAGTGIGLFLAKKFIELHHGAIQIESHLTKGTLFNLSFPISSTALYPNLNH